MRKQRGDLQTNHVDYSRVTSDDRMTQNGISTLNDDIFSPGDVETGANFTRADLSDTNL